MKVSKKNVSLPSFLEEYTKNMTSAEAYELRVLVYVLSKSGDTDTDEICKELEMSETDVISAVSFWRGAGLVESSKGRAKKENDKASETLEKDKNDKKIIPPSGRDTDTRTYTGSEIEKLFSEKPELSSLLEFAQERLGRVFSPSDISKLVYLEDYVLLTAPMIMRIIDYCVELDKKSMRYVEKTALSIYDEGICDYDSLERYFENKKKQKNAEEIVKRIIGIGERNFTSKEKEHISKWFSEYESSTELITLAFEKTIANISKVSVPYMSKLLQSWHEKGYKTPEDVKDGVQQSNDTRGKLDLDMFDEANGKKSNENNKAALDLDDFFENR